MSHNDDRASTWDENKRADTFLGPSGGLVIWCNHESPGRAAIRKGDPVQHLIGVAHLQVSLDRLIDSLASIAGKSPEEYRRIVEETARDLSGLVEHATRVKPTGGGV